MLSIGLWRWYINATITILDIIHCPVFFFKQDASKTGLCLHLQAEPTEVGPLDRVPLCLRTPATTLIQFIKETQQKTPMGVNIFTPCILSELSRLFGYYLQVDAYCASQNPYLSTIQEHLTQWQAHLHAAGSQIRASEIGGRADVSLNVPG
jgi:hypothetical protein